MNIPREQYRYFLKDSVRLAIDFSQTDQSRGVPPPPVEKPFDPRDNRTNLTHPGEWKKIRDVGLVSAIKNRKSHRQFTLDPLSLEEVSFLLWATQGVRERAGMFTAFRTVPSAGCRHALETYLCVQNVTGLETGIYRYLPLEHQLLTVSLDQDLSIKITAAALHQPFVGKAALTFVWTAVPYRMEWRYDNAAYKVIALDAGHVCQNLYLSCAAINAGTCAVAAYNQGLMDELLGVDGEDEFTIYLAPVGRI